MIQCSTFGRSTAASVWQTGSASGTGSRADKHYRHRPHVGVALTRRQAGQDPRVVACAWRAQRRLYQRWQHLHATRGKHANIVTIAVARELATFCWEAARTD